MNKLIIFLCVTFLTLKSTPSVQDWGNVWLSNTSEAGQTAKQRFFCGFRTCSYLVPDAVFQRKTEWTLLKCNSVTRFVFVCLFVLTNINLQVTSCNWGLYCAWQVPIFCCHFLLVRFYFEPTKKLFIYKIHKSTITLLHIVPLVYSNKILNAFHQISIHIYHLLPLTGSFLLIMVSVQGDWHTVQSSVCQYCVNLPYSCKKVFLITNMLNKYI